MDTGDKDFFEALSKVIYSARLENNMTQSELAAKSGLNRTYISDIERGKRNPSVTVLLRIADGLSLSISVIMLRAELILKEGRL